MKKLLGKKGEGSGRDALFGSSKPNPSANPYADAPANDPYASANNGGGPPPPYSGGPPSGNNSMDRFRQEKSGVPQGGYGGGSTQDGGSRFGGPTPPQDNRYGGSGAGGGYGQGSYGNSGGFGQDRYGGPPQGQQQSGSRYGAGGYGGFGQNAGPAQPNTAARDALFANTRPQQPPSGGSGGPPPNLYSDSRVPPPNQYGGSGGYNGPQQDDWAAGRGPGYGQDPSGYEPYGNRQLTAEEQEEEDVQAAKQEIRFLKQQDVASTRNALRIAQQAEEQGRATLERLAGQGESIANSERSLDLASNQNRLAQEKARELKTLNTSIFKPHIGNPFNNAKKAREREQAVLDDAARDREEREQVRRAAWGIGARQQELNRDMSKLSMGQQMKKQSLQERAKYQFEADSEDEGMENEIENNLDQLHGAAKRLGTLASAMGKEVDAQNKHLDRIGGKVDRVDDEIALNRARLDRIK